MIAILNPAVGVGDFHFEESIEQYLATFDFGYLPKEDSNDTHSYYIDNPNMSLWVKDNGLIENIKCTEECLYRGRNMIGMHIDDFLNFYELLPDGDVDELNWEEDGIPQFVYEFNELGLQVWVKNAHVITIIASMPFTDEEE